MYTLPIWAPKPYLSCTDCGKGKAGRVVGNKIGRKKGKSNKKNGTKVFSITAASI